ncbi:MAG: hypothetical protein LAN63_14445 [Acidobacteriia bacterium]|nr:hypothetical protein [Terriglobia bacterium]
MPEETPSTPAAPPRPPAPASSPQPHPLPHMGQEFGTGRKNLPPVKIVLIGVAAIVVVALIVAVVQRPHSAATGSIDDVTAVEIPNQSSVMVAITVSIHNDGKKPFWIHNIDAELDTGSEQFKDDAAAAVDVDRYFQAFPALKQHALAPLKRDAMLEPGSQTSGTIVVSFPVLPDAFAKRKSVKVTIHPYDQPVPLVLTKQ